ncbi:MAG: glutamate-5-semialdehyde dehydrogenase [Kiritimatiellae bacterium]|nr:glutamate-5-semialdehyde dehydrogenase [Kiritimatiellia bacterium]
MDIKSYILEMAQKARSASHKIALLSTEQKDLMLEALANKLEANFDKISSANKQDIQAAKKAGISGAMLDRLELTKSRFDSMVEGVRLIKSLKDPVGDVIWTRDRPTGIKIEKRRVPFGVIAVIFESRPNVFIDTAALCLKAGNAIILRGGKEAICTNAALYECIKDVTGDAVQFVERLEHEAVAEIVRATGLVDMAIPRGGERLIRAVCEASLVPVLKHYKGICHIYVDKNADLDMALKILDNAKTQRPGVCNAAECLLVHEAVASSFMPMVNDWASKKGVTLHAGQAGTEYLSLDINVETVSSLDDAIEFINKNSSGHSDCIVTMDEVAAAKFLAGVDSSSVYHNVSTRFTDGAEFGMGAEIGISTDKLHARGPMGLEELTTYKYIITGKGVVR